MAGRWWFLAALCLAALAGCDSGGGGAADVAESGEQGEARSLLGYLYADCPWQAFPSLPEVGEGCQLDVFLGAAPVGDGVPDVCDGTPLTSRCLLDALGVVIDPAAAVRVDGQEGVTQICTLDEKGDEANCADGLLLTPTRVGPALADGVYELQADRVLSTDGQPGFPFDPLTDDDYEPLAELSTHVVRLSDEGRTVQLSQTCDSEGPAAGTRGTGSDGVIAYDLLEGTFAGARFLFWLTDDAELQAEFTLYGSGVPVVMSERGPLVAAECP